MAASAHTGKGVQDEQPRAARRRACPELQAEPQAAMTGTYLLVAAVSLALLPAAWDWDQQVGIMLLAPP